VSMQLWQHQQDALAAIGDAPGFMLAMDMGTGKSATAIAALEQRGCQSVLILCPKSVASRGFDTDVRRVPGEAVPGEGGWACRPALMCPSAQCCL